MNKINRIESLDSIRGLAALSVVLLHCLLPIPLIWYMVTEGNQSDLLSGEPSTVLAFLLTYTPLHVLWDGGAAVILFFVLSGFVLSLPFFGDRKQKYGSYVIKRFFRIYIPYISSLFLAAIFLAASKNGQNLNFLSDNFNTLWSVPVTFETIVNHIFMIGGTAGKEAHAFNGVIWTLIHEMRISIILPVLIILIKKNSWKIGILVPVFLFLLQRQLWQIDTDSPFLQGLFKTVYYSSFFTFGILVAKYQNNLSRIYRKLNTPAKIGTILLAVILYNWEWGFEFWFDIKLTVLTGWLSALGGCLIIVLLLSSKKIDAFFRRGWMIWLGQISYSLYLIHSPILLFMMYSLHSFIPYWIILLLVPFVSIAAAAIFYKYIEIPSINIGRKYSKKIGYKTKPVEE